MNDVTDLNTLIMWIKSTWNEKEKNELFSFLLSLNELDENIVENLRNLIIKKEEESYNKYLIENENSKNTIIKKKEEIENLELKLSNIENYVLAPKILGKKDINNKKNNGRLKELNSRLEELSNAKLEIEKQIKSYENDINLLEEEREKLMRKIMSSSPDENLDKYNDRVSKISIEQDDIKREINTQKNFLLDFDIPIDEVKFQISKEKKELNNLKNNNKKSINNYDENQIRIDKEKLSLLKSEIGTAEKIVENNDCNHYLPIFDDYLAKMKKRKLEYNIIKKYNTAKKNWNSVDSFNNIAANSEYNIRRFR